MNNVSSATQTKATVSKQFQLEVHLTIQYVSTAIFYIRNEETVLN